MIVGVGCPVGAEHPALAKPLQSREALLTGSQCYSTTGGISDFERCINWVRDGVVDPRAIITHRFALADAAEAFRVAGDKISGADKVVLEL